MIAWAVVCCLDIQRPYDCQTHTMGVMEKTGTSKLMAERGLCSRREADAYIERGWVRVDGAVVAELGSKAWPDQVITLDRQAQRRQVSRVTILLNKPVGYVSAQARSEEHTSELQSLMRISYAVFCLKKKH